MTPEQMLAKIKKLPPEKQAEAISLLSHIKVKPNFDKELFKEQKEFINDTSRNKVLIASRRSGKSYAEGVYLLKTAYEYPNSSLLYLGLTRESASRIMLKDILIPLIEKLKLPCTLNKSQLSLTFENNSVIYLMGIDADEDEKRKLYGQKYKLACIDEAALYSIDIRDLVYGVLKPAMIDNQGTIVLAGMPSDIHHGLFYDLTKHLDASNPGTTTETDPERGIVWSTHRFSAWQNLSIKDKWEKEISEMVAVNPNIRELPSFQQEYLGRWSTDESKLVYKFNPHDNIYDHLPPNENYRYVLGADLGYEDASALTLFATAHNDRTVYCLKSEKKEKLDLNQFSEWVKVFCGNIRPDQYIIDGAAKQAVQTIINQFGIPWQSAKKEGKADFIEIMNAEFKSNRIKLQRESTKQLQDEYNSLIWDDRTDKKLEDPRLSNHCCDSALYAFRKLHHWYNKPTDTTIKTENEREAERERKLKQRILEQQREAEQDAWDNFDINSW